MLWITVALYKFRSDPYSLDVYPPLTGRGTQNHRENSASRHRQLLAGCRLSRPAALDQTGVNADEQLKHPDAEQKSRFYANPGLLSSPNVARFGIETRALKLCLHSHTASVVSHHPAPMP